MAWAKIGCDETVACECDIDILCICPPFLYTTWITHTIEASQPIRNRTTYNSDGGSNYAHRLEDNGAEGSAMCLTSINLSNNAGNDGGFLIVENTYGVSDKEKLSIAYMVGRGACAGAATAPVREIFAYVWANTCCTIDRKDMTNDNSGCYGACSQVQGWGTD